MAIDAYLKKTTPRKDHHNLPDIQTWFYEDKVLKEERVEREQFFKIQAAMQAAKAKRQERRRRG